MLDLGVQITGILSGAFLTGAMTSLSLIAVPVLLDTATSSPQLLRQWSRMYHYGHLIMPSMAGGTLLLHSCTALQQHALGKPWEIFACAGVVTIAIAPFTWTAMEATNGELFVRLERVGGSTTKGSDAAASSDDDLDEVKALVKRWSWLHLMRSMLPLAGTVLGVFGTFAGM